MNETVFRRLLRAAAWISLAGVALGAVLEWVAIWRALAANVPAERQRLLDGSLGVAVFWAMLWVSLPVGAAAFWRHLPPIERALAVALPALMLGGVATALALRSGFF